MYWCLVTVVTRWNLVCMNLGNLSLPLYVLSCGLDIVSGVGEMVPSILIVQYEYRLTIQKELQVSHFLPFSMTQRFFNWRRMEGEEFHSKSCFTASSFLPHSHGHNNFEVLRGEIETQDFHDIFSPWQSVTFYHPSLPNMNILNSFKGNHLGPHWLLACIWRSSDLNH